MPVDRDQHPFKLRLFFGRKIDDSFERQHIHLNHFKIHNKIVTFLVEPIILRIHRFRPTVNSMSIVIKFYQTSIIPTLQAPEKFCPVVPIGCYVINFIINLDGNNSSNINSCCWRLVASTLQRHDTDELQHWK